MLFHFTAANSLQLNQAGFVMQSRCVRLAGKWDDSKAERRSCLAHLDVILTRPDIRCHLRYVFVSFPFVCLFVFLVCYVCLWCLLISQLWARGFWRHLAHCKSRQSSPLHVCVCVSVCERLTRTFDLSWGSTSTLAQKKLLRLFIYFFFFRYMCNKVLHLLWACHTLKNT